MYEDAKTYGALLKSLFLPPDAVNTSTLFGTEGGRQKAVFLMTEPVYEAFYLCGISYRIR